ncbi:MAG TPA: hypothetical protein VFB62_23880, partial [Polyangiaceae bacterium]|nr:hypothetical protein [Polyangiaceae bacterium]
SYVGLMHIYEGFGWSIERGRRFIDEAERIAREHDDCAALGWVTTIRGVASTSLGAWRVSIEQIDEGVALLRARTVGTRWEQTAGLSTALLSLAAMGQIDSLRLRALELERESSEVGDVFGEVEASLYLSFADLAADGPDRARQRIAEAMGRWTHEAFHFQHWTALRYRTFCDLYTGVSDETARRLEVGVRAAREARLFDNQIVRGEASLLEGLVCLADLARGAADQRALERRVDRAAIKLGRERRAWAAASAWCLRGSLAEACGDRDRAIAALRKAREMFVGAHMGLHATVAKLRLGELLPGAAGKSLVTEAREQMMKAHGIAEPERWCNVYLPGPRR